MRGTSFAHRDNGTVGGPCAAGPRRCLLEVIIHAVINTDKTLYTTEGKLKTTFFYVLMLVNHDS